MDENPYQAPHTTEPPRFKRTTRPLGDLVAFGWFVTITSAFFSSAITVAPNARQHFYLGATIWILSSLFITVSLTIWWFKKIRS